MDDWLTTADLAELLGVKPASIRHYRADSLPGGRYESHPFPAPDTKLGNAPAWKASRADEVRAWADTRAGQGAGGGQSAHRSRRDAPSDR